MNIVDQGESVYESSAVVISLQSQKDIGAEGDFINDEVFSVDPFLNDIIEDTNNWFFEHSERNILAERKLSIFQKNK